MPEIFDDVEQYLLQLGYDVSEADTVVRISPTDTGIDELLTVCDETDMLMLWTDKLGSHMDPDMIKLNVAYATEAVVFISFSRDVNTDGTCARLEACMDQEVRVDTFAGLLHECDDIDADVKLMANAVSNVKIYCGHAEIISESHGLGSNSDKTDDVGEEITKLMMAAVSSNCEAFPFPNDDADALYGDDNVMFMNTLADAGKVFTKILIPVADSSNIGTRSVTDYVNTDYDDDSANINGIFGNTDVGDDSEWFTVPYAVAEEQMKMTAHAYRKGSSAIDYGNHKPGSN